MNDIAESDWKLIRKMQKGKLASACDMILSKAEIIVRARKGQEHDSFLKLCNTVNDGNEMIALMFDDLRRSNAIVKIATWRSHGLLNDEELSQFSHQTKQEVSRIAAVR